MTRTLKEISDELGGAVEAAGAGVVSVKARRGKAASGTVWDDGHVLTADHALHDDDNITVSDGSAEHHATVVGRDPGSDLALLKVEGLKARPAPRGSGADLRIGQIVLALGRPESLEATFGVVNSASATSRGWGRWGLGPFIQTDAALNQGFSGGPLVDPEGNVVGINSWYYGRGATRSLPVDAASRVAESLRKHGRVLHAYLGIGTQPVYISEGVRATAGQETGLLVISVAPGGPAEGGGVLQGDILIGVGGEATAGMRDLARVLRGIDPDSKQKLRLVRAGAVAEVELKVGERPGADAAE